MICCAVCCRVPALGPQNGVGCGSSRARSSAEERASKGSWCSIIAWRTRIPKAFWLLKAREPVTGQWDPLPAVQRQEARAAAAVEQAVLLAGPADRCEVVGSARRASMVKVVAPKQRLLCCSSQCSVGRSEVQLPEPIISERGSQARLQSPFSGSVTVFAVLILGPVSVLRAVK